jgi:hypothetical protein
MELDWERNPNQRTFTGDRILVSKFSYELGEPQRWDVIVFKFPNNAKQNYIKRLIGLPGETVRIQHGDIHVRTAEDAPFEIARKPPGKVLAMLQVIDDTPLREWRSCREDRDGLKIEAGSDEQWYRYRHLVANFDDWEKILAGSAETMRKPGNDVGELITDFCPYNAFTTEDHLFRGVIHMGTHWVGDLALECVARLGRSRPTLSRRTGRGDGRGEDRATTPRREERRTGDVGGARDGHLGRRAASLPSGERRRSNLSVDRRTTHDDGPVRTGR